MRAAGLALRFVLELCLLGALAWWGFAYDGSAAVRVALGVGGPLAAAAVWGAFVAPRARVRVQPAVRLAVELALVLAATLALLAASGAELALAFAALWLVDRAVLAWAG